MHNSRVYELRVTSVVPGPPLVSRIVIPYPEIFVTDSRSNNRSTGSWLQALENGEHFCPTCSSPQLFPCYNFILYHAIFASPHELSPRVRSSVLISLGGTRFFPPFASLRKLGSEQRRRYCNRRNWAGELSGSTATLRQTVYVSCFPRSERSLCLRIEVRFKKLPESRSISPDQTSLEEGHAAPREPDIEFFVSRENVYVH